MPECREANPESDSRPWRDCVRNENHPGWHRDGLGYQWPPVVKSEPLSTPAGTMSEEQFSHMMEALDINLTAMRSRSPDSIMRAQLDAMAEELRKAKREIKILKDSEAADIAMAEWGREDLLRDNARLRKTIEKLKRKIRKLKEEC